MWPHIRAFLVALHVLSIVVLSLPRSSIVADERSWNTENAQAEFRRWADRLGTDQQTFRRRLWKVAVEAGRVRDRIGAPFEVYARLTGTGQGWQMFATPQKVPAELHVDVEVDGEWKALVRPLDPRSNWRLQQRTHNRMRKALGRFARTFHRPRYEGLAHWFATQAARDFPEATRVRVGLWRYRSLPPEAVLAGETPRGHYEHELVFEAEELR
jgi:hypothetical protein